MTDPSETSPMSGAKPVLKRGQTRQAQRDARSKAALKANMARRKAQARARAQGEGTDPGETGNDNQAE